MNTAIEPEPVNLFDFEVLAKSKLPRDVYDYYAGGSGDELTLRENRAAFERLKLVPRVLLDVSKRDMTTTVLSQPVSMPVLIAPTAFHGLAHPDGEIATAQAAEKMGTIMVLSTLSNKPLEEVYQQSNGPKWFQLYINRDRGLTRSLVERAETAGYKAICVTVDAPLLGSRDRDSRNRFVLPPGLSLGNFTGEAAKLKLSEAQGSALMSYFAEQLDQSLTWKDLEWLKSITGLPIVIKGIHHPSDAELVAKSGSAAIVVSNHGGRQLDTAPASIDMLPSISDSVGGQLEIFMDGGVRRGVDVIKALALGARAVLIGRPVLWGLSVGGTEGVEKVLSILQREIDVAMALCGVRRLSEITSDLVTKSV